MEALNNIGDSMQKLGQDEEALDYFEQSLEIAKEIGNKEGKMKALDNIGDSMQKLGHDEEALDYFEQCLEIAKEIGKEKVADNVRKMETLNNIGEELLKLGKYGKVLNYFKQSLKIAQKIGNKDGEMEILSNIGEGLLKLGHYEEALNYFKQSLKIAQKIGNKDGQIFNLIKMSIIYNKLSKYNKTIQSLKKSITHIESMRSSLSHIDYKIDYFENHLLPYLMLVQIYVKKWQKEKLPKHLYESFIFMERMRARGFLDQMFQAHILTSSKENYPAYNQLLEPKILSPVQVQDYLKRDDILFAYLIYEDLSLLWIITQKEMTLIPLEVDSKTLKKMVNEFNSPIRSTIENILQKKELDIATLEKLDLNLAHRLYHYLIAPANEYLKDKKHIIIIPHGGLLYLPFETLLTKSYDAEQFKQNREDLKILLDEYQDASYLIKSYQISYLQSASLFPLLNEPKKHTHTLVAFANSGLDPNYISSSLRSIHSFNIRSIGRLQYSVPGTINIAKTMGLENCTLYLDGNATETRVKNEDFTKYDYIHLSCHTIDVGIDEMYQQPALLFNPDNYNDGVINMIDITRLKTDADMVSLAACETGKGLYQYGEGITNLTRAFMYSGTPSVLASLWKVEDEATSKLMVKLYENLKTLKKSEALKKAKLSLMSEKSERKINYKDRRRKISYAHPFFWAPFVLYGEGRDSLSYRQNCVHRIKNSSRILQYLQ
jgi:CHAT domain-containing protein/Tfp pilus assembly protein PilF